MASRKEELSFMVQRFKGFWQQYKQSKRGLLGIIIIVFYALIAIFAPFISPLDPLSPTTPGYYPGQTPRLAEKLCVPTWYRTLGGAQNLSENLLVMQDHEFSSEEAFNTEWTWATNAPQSVSIQYSATKGSHDNDGCVEILYQREENKSLPEDGFSSISLIKDFEYPYYTSPKSFWIHYSIYVENRTNLHDHVFNILLQISREDGSTSSTFLIKKRTITIGSFLQAGKPKWFHKAEVSEGIRGDMEEIIFTKKGNYTFKFVIQVLENVEEKTDLTIYVDNLQLLTYGQAFGLLGTDANENTPRDLFTMLIHGTRISFMIGLLTAFFSVILGLMVGLIAGYVRGMVDELLMRFADFLLVLPGLPLLIVLVTVLGRSIWNIIGVLIFMGWMGFSRSVRSMVLSLRERPFVESAKAAGAGTLYIISRHILPNVFALVYVTMATSVPGAIISEASLSWLGLGDKNVPSWGQMLFDFSRTQTAVVKGLGEYWFWVVPPGVAIALMAMAFILMGFSLDEILNPRLRKRR